jgi:hypothetical protein
MISAICDKSKGYVLNTINQMRNNNREVERMRDIIIRKSLIYGIILTLVVTSLSPSMMGIVTENQKVETVSIVSITDTYDYSSIRMNNVFSQMEKICEIYDLDFNPQIFDEDLGIDNPFFPAGLFDYLFKGYVTDASTNDPIVNAEFLLVGIGKHMSFDLYSTTTGSDGYYELALEQVAYGGIYFIRAEGYYTQYSYQLDYWSYEIWVNASLEPGAPPKNSKVHGYILDAYNAEPIEDAVINMNSVDAEGHGDWPYVYSDSSGYYSLNVPAGEVFGWVSADNYYVSYGPEKEVGEGKTVQIDFYLYERIPDTATLCGYITDEITEDPIEDILIELYSDNWELHHFDWNYTFTDSSGYYEIHTAASELQISPMSFWHADCWSEHYTISEGETYWWNATIYEIPPQTSVLCGYITDEITHEPIENADISLDWDDNEGHYYYKFGFSDDTGFYKINIAPGDISLFIFGGRHFYTRVDDFPIGEDETLWKNFTLEPHPTDNSVVRGNILGDKSINSKPIKGNSPIEGAQVVVRWDNNQQSYSNVTYTDASGYYEMGIAAGMIRLRVYAEGYGSFWTEDFNIDDGETKTIDFELEAVKMNISIIKPTKGIYLNNNYLFGFFVPIIIGSIDIEVTGNDNLYEVIFFVDNEFKRAIPAFEPFIYTWKQGSSGWHTIKVVCNGAWSFVVTKTINVWKLF